MSSDQYPWLQRDLEEKIKASADRQGVTNLSYSDMAFDIIDSLPPFIADMLNIMLINRAFRSDDGRL